MHLQFSPTTTDNSVDDKHSEVGDVDDLASFQQKYLSKVSASFLRNKSIKVILQFSRLCFHIKLLKCVHCSFKCERSIDRTDKGTSLARHLST